ncbi:DMT family transporter [Hafnia alvei]|uniref:DMT family transporter n=1 Tax=Hafnia alvei TaxID=569 RepID=UPI000E0E1255|nr:DMT family transporter [Hafnia alvei]
MNGAYIPLVIMAGMGLSVEAGLLGPLGEEVGHLWATLSIFGVGAALLFLISLLTGKPTEHRSFSSLPRWQLTGGLLGSVYVIMLTLATPVIGVAMTMIAILSGQVAKSLLIDHFGWFGISRKRVGVQRLLALALIVAALILIAEGA